MDTTPEKNIIKPEIVQVELLAGDTVIETRSRAATIDYPVFQVKSSTSPEQSNENNVTIDVTIEKENETLSVSDSVVTESQVVYQNEFYRAYTIGNQTIYNSLTNCVIEAVGQGTEGSTKKYSDMLTDDLNWFY